MTTSPYKVDFNVGSEFGSSDCYVLPSLDSVSLHELQNVQIETNIEEMKAFSCIFKYLSDEYISVGYPPNQPLCFRFLIDGDINNYSISIESNDNLVFNFSNLLFYKEDLINIISNPSVIKDLVFEHKRSYEFYEHNVLLEHYFKIKYISEYIDSLFFSKTELIRFISKNGLHCGYHLPSPYSNEFIQSPFHFIISHIGEHYFTICFVLSGVGTFVILKDSIEFDFHSSLIHPHKKITLKYNDKSSFCNAIDEYLKIIKSTIEMTYDVETKDYMEAIKLMEMVSI